MSILIKLADNEPSDILDAVGLLVHEVPAGFEEYSGWFHLVCSSSVPHYGLHGSDTLHRQNASTRNGLGLPVKSTSPGSFSSA